MVSVLLVSASERRKEILSGLVSEPMKLRFRTLATEEINPPSGTEVSSQVEMICSAKAESAAEEMTIGGENPELAIVSDTLVEDPNDPMVALGKPVDELSAASMLLGLSGRRHRVWSATAVLYPPLGQTIGTEVLHGGWTADLWTDSALVEFEELTQDTLADLVASESWVGKAGAYDLAGMAGEYATLIEGDEVTVLGFAQGSMKVISSLIG